MAERSAYAVLGLQKGATDSDIKAAYIELVKKFDPEKHTERFMVIQNAYERLRDIKKRAKEDIHTFNVIRGEFTYLPDEKTAEAPADAAIDSARNSYRQNAGDENSRKALLAQLMRRSHVSVTRKMWTEAIRDWAEIQQVDPSHVRARNNLNYAYITLGHSYALHGLHSEAIDLWERAMQMNPDNYLLIHNLALVCEQGNEPEKAARYWSEAVRRWKSHLESSGNDDEYLKACIIEAHRYHGDMLDRQAQSKAPTAPSSGGGSSPRGPIAQPDRTSAIDRYREVLKLNPDDFDARYQISTSLMESGKWTDAVEELQKLHQRHPKNIEVLNALGWSFLNSGQVDNSFNTWNKSMAVDPKNSATRETVVRAHLMMGKQFRNKGMFTPALVHFKKLLRYLPDSAEVHLEIAATYDMKGEIKSAAQEYNEVLAIDPKNKLARKALNDLRLRR